MNPITHTHTHTSKKKKHKKALLSADIMSLALANVLQLLTLVKHLKQTEIVTFTNLLVKQLSIENENDWLATTVWVLYQRDHLSNNLIQFLMQETMEISQTIKDTTSNSTSVDLVTLGSDVMNHICSYLSLHDAHTLSYCKREIYSDIQHNIWKNTLILNFRLHR